MLSYPVCSTEQNLRGEKSSLVRRERDRSGSRNFRETRNGLFVAVGMAFFLFFFGSAGEVVTPFTTATRIKRIREAKGSSGTDFVVADDIHM